MYAHSGLKVSGYKEERYTLEDVHDLLTQLHQVALLYEGGELVATAVTLAVRLVRTQRHGQRG